MVFNIGIPTMWKSPYFSKMLVKYEKCPYIKNIYVVDNDTSESPMFTGFKKLVYLPQEENIFVNPAWNLIASYANPNEHLIIANDDIYIKDLDQMLRQLYESPFELTGARIFSQEKKIEGLKKFPAQSWGSFLCFKPNKYLYIPEQLRVYMGDKYFFDKLSCGWIGGYIQTPRSATVSALGVKSFLRKEGAHYDRLTKTYPLNVIIRTSNRPRYFYNAIRSVLKYFPEAKIHVTVDQEKDLRYVQKIAPNCNFYQINTDTIKNFAKHHKIERRAFPYNLYLNVVRPFLDGWCLILDDDCQLVSRPIIPKNKREIVISKVDIRSRVVPEEWQQEPKFGDIDMGGILFHSSQMVDFTPQRGGDYKFIHEMFKKSKTIWNDNVLVQMQTGLNQGNRKDLP